jgi:EAL domain-containing protein (putative c-di-GMP-specific phosphodiesterase class I)/CheY-like chemotaxis protein
MRMSLPDRPDPPGPGPADAASQESGGGVAAGLAVLVVEDHEFQRSMMVEMLEGLGARVVREAVDGAAALALTRDGGVAFDVIVTDIDMPGIDGMALIRELGEARIAASLIISSGLDRALLHSIETMSAAYGLRLLGTIEKPASPARFAELIGRHVQARRAPERPRGAEAPYALEEVLAGLANGEFEPFFQPKVELRTGRVKGAEALARWRHPRDGWVFPNAFIALLEEGGHIDRLTEAMLTGAAAQCQQWNADGLELDVSVNLSIAQLGTTGAAEAVMARVIVQGLDPRQMILEITESAAMTNVGPVLENLNRLRMKGFGLSIDDYGTGYSSMQQLTRIPFTELKIDRSFVAGAASRESSRVILESSLAMARRLNIQSVAEGAETRDDWDLLLACGCDLVQGYFVARPMEAASFAGWMRDWRPPGLA